MDFWRESPYSFPLLILCYCLVLTYLHGNLLNERMQQRIKTAPVIAARGECRRRRASGSTPEVSRHFRSHFAVLVSL